LNKIYELVKQIWEEERIPDEWKEPLIVPNTKKDIEKVSITGK
jgi:hypothetical protein